MSPLSTRSFEFEHHVEQPPGYGPPAPVPIFQHEAEFSKLLGLYKERQPAAVLEIGTYHGGTLYHWLTNASPGAKVVSVDSYAAGVDNRHRYNDWRPDTVNLFVIEGDSQETAVANEVRRLGPYDWVFIDAGHYYHEVKRDWELYGPMVRKGGVCVFHDILPPSEEHPEIEVARLWEEIKLMAFTEEIVADREASWGGLGVAIL